MSPRIRRQKGSAGAGADAGEGAGAGAGALLAYGGVADSCVPLIRASIFLSSSLSGATRLRMFSIVFGRTSGPAAFLFSGGTPLDLLTGATAALSAFCCAAVFAASTASFIEGLSDDVVPRED